jgi:hypothetical protein
MKIICSNREQDMQTPAKYMWTVPKTFDIKDEYSHLTEEEQTAFMSIITSATEWLYEEKEGEDELIKQWKNHMAVQRAKLIADLDFEYYKHLALARKGNFKELGGVIHFTRILTIPSLVYALEEGDPVEGDDDYTEDVMEREEYE